MDSLATTVAAHPNAPVRPLPASAVAAWALGFAPVVALALSGGGYDAIVRGQVGIVAWWLVLLGVLSGVASVARLDRWAWLAIALLAGFALWTGVASGWSESAERSVAELGRVATLLGVFVLGVLTVRRRASTPLIDGMACAFGLVALLAVLSRLHPGWFPDDQTQEFLGGGGERLNYPLNYANGTGNFLAIGVPLLLGVATQARTIAGRAAAAAALPVVVLAIGLTVSRGAVLTAVVGLIVFFVLSADRIPKLASALVAGGGCLALVLALLARTELRNGLRTPAAMQQADQFELLLLLVCVVVAVLQVGVALATRRRERTGWLQIPARRARRLTALACVLAAGVAVASGLPGALSTQWRNFKSADAIATDAGNTFSRLGTVTGSNRYQYWQSAIDASHGRIWTGRGPGTFEFWWARNGPITEFIRDAHSIYLQTLAEAGIVGLLLLGGFFLTLLGLGTARSLRAPPDLRGGLATATACLAAFCAAAAYDWVWQIAVVPLAALLLGAVLVGGREAGAQQRSTIAGRVAIAALAIAGLGAVTVPYATTSLVRDSQAKVLAAGLPAALAAASSAQRLQPAAASPRLQRALVLERAGDFDGAARAAAQATRREATNWRPWLVLSRVEARRGHVRAAVRAYRRARALNPRSAIFAR